MKNKNFLIAFGIMASSSTITAKNHDSNFYTVEPINFLGNNHDESVNGSCGNGGCSSNGSY